MSEDEIRISVKKLKALQDMLNSDESFRKKLIADPKGVLQEHGINIPSEMIPSSEALSKADIRLDINDAARTVAIITVFSPAKSLGDHQHTS